MNNKLFTTVFSKISGLSNNVTLDMKLFMAATILFSVVAFNSVGYHQEDEHYQLVEFANYKLGWTTIDRLAWEYDKQIRPGLQPLICFIIFKLYTLIFTGDGYNLVLVLRLLSASIVLFAIKIFVQSYKNEIDEKLRPYFSVMAYSLWFIPFVAVRFSSENWSGIFFLFSLTVIRLDRNKLGDKRYLLTGILLGTSILFRYQSALLVVGILLWFIIIDKIQLKKLILLTFGIAAMLLIGFFIDYWLYDKNTITLYNYFFQNIINGVASSFGVSPWYEYIMYIIKSPGPIGIFIFLSLFVVLYHQPKNIILWAVIPFLLVHSMIPHKELRFLFPLVYVAPLFLILGYQYIYKQLTTKLIAILVVTISIVNMAGLLAVSTTGASSQIAVSSYIHRSYNSESVNIILCEGANPFIDWHPPFNSFYSSVGLNIHRVNSIWQADFIRHKRAGLTNIIVINNDDITGPRTQHLLKKYGLTKVYQNIPTYILPIYNWYNESLNESAMAVYEFK